MSTSDYLATLAAITAMATILLVYFTWKLSSSTNRLADITNETIKLAREEFISTKRAYVFIDEIRIENLGDENKLRVQPIWRNSGTTPTKGMRNHCNWKFFEVEPPDSYAFPDFDANGVEDKSGAGNVPLFIGPNGTVQGQTLYIPTEYLNKVIAGKGHILVWGWTEYRDVIETTQLHRTKFCNKLIIETSKRIEIEGQAEVTAGLSLILHRSHNCMDEECDQHLT